jgi:hypothetical protein
MRTSVRGSDGCVEEKKCAVCSGFRELWMEVRKDAVWKRGR